MNLLRTASTVSLWTLVSRISGLVRDQLIAAAFGAGAMTDAFNVAFRIPNLLRRLFGEGAFSAAFVPIIAATRAKDGDEATRALTNSVATALFWALGVTCVLGMLAAPAIVFAFGAGLKERELAVEMTRWMFPYLGFICLVALSAGVLNAWKQFAVPAATPILLNVAMIGCSLLLAPWLERHGVPPIHALTAGVLLGGVLQLGLQFPALARIGALPRIACTPAGVGAAWHHPGVRLVLQKMAPALLGVSVAQLSMLINTQIASHLSEGAVSWMFYAERLMEFPTALLGVALGVVLMPGLSALRAKGDDAGYAAQLDWGMRLAALLALPCTVALLFFSVPLVAVLFHNGRFSAEAVAMSALALQGYGAGLMGMIGVKVLAPGFYAQQDMRTPVLVAVFVLACTQLMNVALVPLLGHAGLALAIGLGSLLNAASLFVLLRRRGLLRVSAGWGVFLLRVAVACGAMGAWMVWIGQHLDWIALAAHKGQRAAWMAASLGLSALIYFGVLRALGLDLRRFRHPV